MQATLQQLAERIGATVKGDESCEISILCAIDDIKKDALVFAIGAENLKKAEQSSAKAILTDHHCQESSKHLLVLDKPFQAFIALIHFFYPAPKAALGIHPTAILGDNVQLGDNVSIGPYVCIGSGCIIGEGSTIKSQVSIGDNVTVGERCVLYSNVVIYDNCSIGDGVIIHASSTVGSDGFGYHLVQGRQQKVPHVGNVIIEDDVEIGANTTIDRATLGSTVIGEGTKIDNQVQIAHSVKLGKHNIICAFTGIAGSSSSGDYVVLAANVGISDHVRIDTGAVLGARTGVAPHKHLQGNQVYFGSPARPKEKAIALELSANRIPGMRKRITKLEEKLRSLTEETIKA